MRRQPGYQPGERPARCRTGDNSKPGLWRERKKVSVFRQHKNEPGDANDQTGEQTGFLCYSTFSEQQARHQGQHQRGKHLEIRGVGISPGQQRDHIGEDDTDKTQETPKDHCGKHALSWSCQQDRWSLSRSVWGNRHLESILLCLLHPPLFSLIGVGFLRGERGRSGRQGLPRVLATGAGPPRQAAARWASAQQQWGPCCPVEAAGDWLLSEWQS